MALGYSTDSVRVMAPIAITSAMITASTITPEDPNPVYAGGTTYAKGARVFVASTHRVYESLKDANTGHDPTVDTNRFDATGTPTWWWEVGPTNAYAMFDGMVSTQSVGASPLTVTLTPGAFNGFAMFGLDGDHIHVVIKDMPGGTVIYDYNEDLENSAPPDYYEHFFDPFRPQTVLIATGLDPYKKSEITFTITKTTGTPKIGMFACGDLRPLGAPLRGASVEPQDFSSITTNEFGTTTVRKRHNATGMVISAKMPIEDANYMLDNLRQLLGTPCVVIGSDKENYEGLTVFGLISGRMGYDEYGENTLNITVKGMV